MLVSSASFGSEREGWWSKDPEVGTRCCGDEKNLLQCWCGVPRVAVGSHKLNPSSLVFDMAVTVRVDASVDPYKNTTILAYSHILCAVRALELRSACFSTTTDRFAVPWQFRAVSLEFKSFWIRFIFSDQPRSIFNTSNIVCHPVCSDLGPINWLRRASGAEFRYSTKNARHRLRSGQVQCKNDETKRMKLTLSFILRNVVG